MLHAFGSVGLVLLLGAYYLLSIGRIESRGRLYQAMNLAGGVILIGYSYALEAWATVVLNAVWATIAAVALARAARAR